MWGQGLRVLVAEDEILAGQVIQEVLLAEGYDVLLAENGREALELAARHPIDALVTDLSMPEVTGQELIQQLRMRQPNLPVVVMTGYLPPETLPDLFRHGAPPLGVLLKPFEIGRLVGLLEGLRQRRHMGVRLAAAS